MNLYNKVMYQVEKVIPWIFRTAGKAAEMAKFGVANLFTTPGQALQKVQIAVQAFVLISQKIKIMGVILKSLTHTSTYLDPALFTEAYDAVNDAVNNIKAHIESVPLRLETAVNETRDGIIAEGEALKAYIKDIGRYQTELHV